MTVGEGLSLCLAVAAVSCAYLDKREPVNDGRYLWGFIALACASLLVLVLPLLPSTPHVKPVNPPVSRYAVTD